MGMKRVVVASVLLGACGPKAKTADGPGNTAEAAKLCIDPATAQGDVIGPDDAEAETQAWMASGNEELAALEPGRNLMAVVAADGAQYAVEVTEGCYQGACEPKLVRAEGAQVTAWAALPFADTIPTEGDYPFLVNWLAAQGDEIWLGYNIVGEPEPAVGSTTRNYLAVFGAADLAPRWSAEVSSYPEAGSLETCEGNVVAVDADCDGDLDLVQRQRCNPGECEQDPDGEMMEEVPDYCTGDVPVSHTVYARGADGVYAERK